jgi:hypothetical protein
MPFSWSSIGSTLHYEHHLLIITTLVVYDISMVINPALFAGMHVAISTPIAMNLQCILSEGVQYHDNMCKG